MAQARLKTRLYIRPRARSIDGLPTTFERTIGTAAKPIDDAVESAVKAFTVADPSASAPALAQGLKLTREAIAAATDPDIRHVLTIKEQQFQDAINACVGATLIAVTNPPVMSAPVAGQTFNVDARLEIRGKLALTPSAPVLTGAAGWAGVEGTVRRHRVRCRRRGDQHEAIFLEEGAAGEPIHAFRHRAVWPAGLSGAVDRDRVICRRWSAGRDQGDR